MQACDMITILIDLHNPLCHVTAYSNILKIIKNSWSEKLYF